MRNSYMDGSAGKRLLVTSIVLGLLVLLTGAYRAPVSASCSSAKVTWYEENNYGGGSHVFTPATCTTNVLEDMTVYQTGDGHACARGFPVFPPSLLNDCASSWKIIATCHNHVGLYVNSNKTGPMDVVSVSLNRATMPAGWDDALSSIYFWYTSACISAPQ